MKWSAPNSNLQSPDFSAQSLLTSHLPLTYFTRPSPEVARDLLGKGLWTEFHGQQCLVEMVEVEAYLGTLDPASHTFRGPNRRNRSMFLEGGICYVYLSYGINFCMNVVTGPPGLGEAVLLRAARPICGIPTMLARRNLSQVSANLLNGPGKLTQALGIDLSHDGAPLTEGNLRVVDLGINYKEEEIGRGPRIGISKAVDLPLRFVVKDSPWLSRRTQR